MSAPAVPLLLYHSVSDDHDPRFAEWAVSPSLFDAHMSYLAGSGYRALTVSQLAERVYGRDEPPDERTIAVTFDDAFRDFYDEAWPILQRHGIPATMYVTTGRVGATSSWLADLGEGDRPIMSWDQLLEVSAAGVECGAHTQTHPQLDLLPASRRRAEIDGSKRELERVLGPVRSFAYPHGYHTRSVRQQVRRAGFGNACAVGDALAAPDGDRYAITRLIVRGGMSVEALERALGGTAASARTLQRAAWRTVRRAGGERLAARPRRPGASPILRVTSPAPRTVWRDLIAADRDALASQTPDWIDAICAGGRFVDGSRLYETMDGKRIVLPLARRAGVRPRSLAALSSMPESWGMGGLVAEAPVEPAEMRAVTDDLRSLPALRVLVRPNPVHAELWAAATWGARAIPCRAHVLSLQGGPEEVWKERFASSVRRAIRKAERLGVTTRSGSDRQLIRDFHALFDVSVIRWAKTQHEPLILARARAALRDPLVKFELLGEVLGDDVFRIHVAYLGGRPAAAIVVLLGRDASYTRGAMDKEFAGSSGANELLHWTAIQEACAAGCARYHMGETARSATLAHFKEKLGAIPIDYAEYRFEHLPLTPADLLLRNGVKRLIGFRDA